MLWLWINCVSTVKRAGNVRPFRSPGERQPIVPRTGNKPEVAVADESGAWRSGFHYLRRSGLSSGERVLRLFLNDHRPAAGANRWAKYFLFSSGQCLIYRTARIARTWSSFLFAYASATDASPVSWRCRREANVPDIFRAKKVADSPTTRAKYTDRRYRFLSTQLFFREYQHFSEK